MLTSRIKQGIGSVQLFIQRALMNLEPNVIFDDEHATEWRTWRSRYVLWQANREVFLYPENWIYPELRDDKTPYFQSLENELRQRDVTKDSVEDGFRNYLERLDQVARLDIAGMYHDLDNGVLHVIGRTFAQPHVYFYRYWQDATSSWSPWTKVDLDIPGEHVLPVVWNRRLYLFWPIFTETPSNAKDGLGGSYFRVSLAWSQLKNGRWMPKKVSSLNLEFVITSGLDDDVTSPHSPYVLKAHPDPSSDALTISVLHATFDSHDPYWFIGTFTFDGCSEQPRASGDMEDNTTAQALAIPYTLTNYFNYFIQPSPNQPFFLWDVIIFFPIPMLQQCKYPFNILYPHQYDQYFGLDSFFFQDSLRTFFARFDQFIPIYWGWGSSSDSVRLEDVGRLRFELPYETAPQALRGNL
jgi:hypothetical protein